MGNEEVGGGDMEGEGDSGARHDGGNDVLSSEVDLEGVDEGLEEEGGEGEGEVGGGGGRDGGVKVEEEEERVDVEP